MLCVCVCVIGVSIYLSVYLYILVMTISCECHLPGAAGPRASWQGRRGGGCSGGRSLLVGIGFTRIPNDNIV